MFDIESFRREARAWLEAHCPPEMRLPAQTENDICWGGRRFTFQSDAQRAWMQCMAERGWTVPSWPKAYGGAALSKEEAAVLRQEMRALGCRSPLDSFGIWMLGPALLTYGSEEQKQEHLPKIARGEIRWCQGYSEPNAGSDLANVQTRAVLSDDGSRWLITGQKVWTSLAHWAQWCFVVARTEPGSQRHKGLSYLLVPLGQPGVDIRPIVQITGTSEFNEVFFDEAACDAANVVGGVGDGWKVAMGTLGFERGVSTLAQQIGFEHELGRIVDQARANGRSSDPVVRQRIADAWIGLRLMRYNALRAMTGLEDGGAPGPEASISKLHWASWHRDMANLGMDVLGPTALIDDEAQRLFLFTRADTIYGGSNEIQRNVIGERVLGLPREPGR
jgi:alkylation response protein AidB-like acyl-CoA dehydrogenase